jgi:hypothetical protein
MPTMGADELLALELLTPTLELLLPTPLADELDESLLFDPPQPHSASAASNAAPRHEWQIIRPRARLIRFMRHLH